MHLYFIALKLNDHGFAEHKAGVFVRFWYFFLPVLEVHAYCFHDEFAIR